jgi:hypothetical protein
MEPELRGPTVGDGVWIQLITKMECENDRHPKLKKQNEPE